MPKYLERGSTTRVYPDTDLIVRDRLEKAVYTLQRDQEGEFFLNRIADGFKQPEHLYGTAQQTADRILATYRSRPRSTGVLLSGEKGCGKTLLAKLICEQSGAPVITINEPLHGEVFNKFLHSIEQDCVVLFDEFEKVYEDHKDQNAMLTVLDGVFQSRKLFILTCNEAYKINTHMINRPGRLFYSLKYTSQCHPPRPRGRVGGAGQRGAQGHLAGDGATR